MSPLPRRRVLAAALAAPLATPVLLAAEPAVAANPDAPLIALCDSMPAVLRDLNAAPGDLDDTSPEWLPYDRVANAMCAARPETLEGVMAMARATAVYAGEGADDEEPDGVVAVWAWAIVQHLLRIEGKQ